MHGREHRLAVKLAAPAGLVDQLPGGVAGRVLEGRAASLLADRLGAFPARGDRLHPGFDLGRIAGRAAIEGAGEDQLAGGRRSGLAVGEAHVGIRQRVLLAEAMQSVGLDQDVLGLRAVATGVHHAGAADGPRHAAIELQSRDARLPRLARQNGVQGRRPGVDGGIAPWLDLGEGATHADHHTLDPAIADQQVGSDADGHHRDGWVQSLEEDGQVVLVLRQEQQLGRPADAQPSVGRQHRVPQQLAADGRQPIAPVAHPFASA